MSVDVVSSVRRELFIAGEWQPAADGGAFPVTDPATGEVIAEVAAGTPTDAVAAVAAAADAAPGWAATAPRARGEILRRTFEAMTAERDELAALIVRESGKSWRDALGEVGYAAEFFRWFSEEAVRIDGGIVTAPAGTNRILTLRQPVGVSVFITPWNFPAAMATRKIGPALAAGCTVVLKPAKNTPLTALRIAELMAQAGLPPGVVNVLPAQRAGAAVGAMLEDSRTRKVSFTGSTEVGVGLLKQAASRVVNCSMELGGNAPFLVFADADLDAAVEGALVAKMRNGGESCIAANRFLVEEPVARAFADRLAARMAALRVGPGLDPANDVGPVIDGDARDDLDALVGASVDLGASVLTGGRALDGRGFFYAPTVLQDVPADAPMLRTEIFGPVAPIVTFAGEQEALAAANDTEYGLAAYVYTGDLSRALRVAEGIDAGVIGVNRGFVSDPAAPFGGMKQSGLGREGGHDGLLEFLETKYIAAQW